MSAAYSANVITAIKTRQSFMTPQMGGYATKGGTYMITSGSLSDDSGKPRDLIAVTPFGLVRLAPNVNPVPLADALGLAVLS